MEVLLCERLVCPRCGPPFGLVLLADRVVDKRVLQGSLGCPNCRDRFPIAAGHADLRAPPRDALSEAVPEPQPPLEETTRIAALLGITSGPARVLLIGSASEHAVGLAGMIPELEVIAVSGSRRAGPERSGVSPMAAGPGLPFQSHALQGAALGADAEDRLEEAARSIAPASRLVLLGSVARSRQLAGAAGLQILMDQDGVLLAEKAGPRAASGGFRLPVVKGPQGP